MQLLPPFDIRQILYSWPLGLSLTQTLKNQEPNELKQRISINIGDRH